MAKRNVVLAWPHDIAVSRIELPPPGGSRVRQSRAHGAQDPELHKRFFLEASIRGAAARTARERPRARRRDGHSA